MVSVKCSSHARSISLPSQSHPLEDARVDSNFASSCTSSSSLSQSLLGIKHLYESLHESILLPTNQQALSRQCLELDRILEGSIGLLDFCGSTGDLLSEMKDSLAQLQSSLRRRNLDDISTYKASTRKITKLSIGLEKKIEKASILQQKDAIATAKNNASVVRALKQAQVMTLSTLKSVFTHVSGSKHQQGQSLVSKLVKGSKPRNRNGNVEVDNVLFALQQAKSFKPDNGVVVQDLVTRLEGLQMSIHEAEVGLELLSRALLKIRVSLLNLRT